MRNKRAITFRRPTLTLRSNVESVGKLSRQGRNINFPFNFQSSDNNYLFFSACVLSYNVGELSLRIVVNLLFCPLVIRISYYMTRDILSTFSIKFCVTFL